MGAVLFCFFFFNDTATTEIYTLSLHDALPIYGGARLAESVDIVVIARRGAADRRVSEICRELSTLVAEGPAATKPGAGE